MLVDEIGELAERAAAHPRWERHAGNFWRINTVVGLIAAERYDLAEQLLGRALDHATRAGSALRVANTLMLRGLTRCRHGDLRGAEDDLRSVQPPPRSINRSVCLPAAGGWASSRASSGVRTG